MADKTSLLGKQKRDLSYERETKWALKKHKERSEEKEVKARVELLETKSEANLIPVKDTVEGLDESPHFVEGVAERKKTLIVDNISVQAKIPDLINFFKDDGKVVRVRIFVNHKGLNLGFGSVEFASANEAKTALEKKNGEYLHGEKMTLGLAKTTPYPQRPRFCLERKVWYKDHFQRESFPVDKEEIPPRFFEAIAGREETIFVANLSPQTKMLHIIKFFRVVGKILSVRLIVDREGKHVGYGFLEFANAYDAKKVLEKKNGEYLDDHMIFLNGAKSAPCPPRPKYSLAEKLWYEDYLLRESFPLEEDEQESLPTEADETLEEHDETPNFFEAASNPSIRQKTLFIDNMSCQTKISDIINLFKDVGEVVHVRLIVTKMGELKGRGFVEFASAGEAKKAQEKKNGEYLCGNQITLCVAEKAPHLPPPKYCIDHKVWYEDYLRGESLLIEEEDAMEGLDDFYEEVSLRKKTLFISKLPVVCKIIRHIINFFYDVGEVGVRLIVDDMGKHVGCGFVTFASAIEAKKGLGLRKKIRGMACGFIYLDKLEIAPYPLRPKYNLAEKRWYEDYLPRERLYMEGTVRKRQFCGKKITFTEDDD
ncbi:unnamed protein product [Cuscuta campestris]|uniref:RRM domain-containing protein n=1 Tax=Cuscuta campestris TaxID=132261 RepID=A0A484LJ48_9ASTE|nr:unnamed protein product [Cuscuta campestris]